MNAVDQRVCKFCRTVLTVTVTNQQPLGLIAGFAGEKEIRIIELAENGFTFRSTQRPIDIGTYPNSYFNRPVHMDLYCSIAA